MAKTSGSRDQARDDADVGDVVDAINANTAVELANLRAEMQEMRGLVAAIFGLDAMTQVLENGFGTISDQLRQLVPQSNAVSLDETVARRIGQLRDSLRAPDLSDIGRLEVGYRTVPSVTAPIDDRDRWMDGDAS